jgi:sterol 3beta-glucosyltransferase
MARADPERFTEMALTALRRTGRRGILLSGWTGLGLGQADLPDDVCLVHDIPHDWLFPQVAAVVHHGGAGTTAAGLRAGRPTVILPFFADQPFWGRRTQALGVGPAPIMQPDVTVDNLTAAIGRATADPALADRAVRLGERIRAEDGVARAVAVLDQTVTAGAITGGMR